MEQDLLGATVILPDLILESNQNQSLEFAGIDDGYFDKLHLQTYPHKISYRYNSRGFRDQEWPNSYIELQNAIWCVGDSFTVGIGSPIEHTWPWQLSKLSNQRVINVSMDGASNQWISRTAKEIINAIGPRRMAIMWSYTHRREHHNSFLNDRLRRLHFIKSTTEQDWDNFLSCKSKVESDVQHLVQFTIPNFHNIDVDSIWNEIKGKNWPAKPPTNVLELNALPQQILDEIKNLHNCFDKMLDFLKISQNQFGVIPVTQQDIARDGHHFDLITAEWVARQAAQHLAC